VRLALLGVRGSTPAPGADFLRYGGHTSCLAVLGDGQDVPSLVLDAGTGIRDLPRLLNGKAFEGAVVLTHLHWDHMHGLPFCTALDHPGSQVELWVPSTGAGPDAEELLAKALSPPHFPIDPFGLLGSWTFRPALPGPLAIEPQGPGAGRVEVAPVLHKGGRTYAVRVDLDGASIAYVPDHNLRPSGPADVDDSAAIELIHGVDVLLHDGQFVAAEAELAAAYGHCTVEDSLRWADRCQAGRLVLTHHGPSRTDDQLDRLAAEFTVTPEGRPVTFARQGDLLDVLPGTK
jgi:phosphoribosyl 1,2-cyclic phosphodiesterase